MDNFSEEFVRGEAARPDYMVHTGEHVALLVDSSELMQTTRYCGPLSVYKGLTLFEVALRQVQDIVASRLAFGMEAEIVIIFFNTLSTTRDLKGVQVWHPASPPSVDVLQRLHNCSSVQFEYHGMRSFRNALAAAILEFYDGRNPTDAPLVVAAWTCLADTHAGSEDDDTIIDSILELVQKRDGLLQIVCVDDVTPGDVEEGASKWIQIIKRLQNSRRKYCSTWNILNDPFNDPYNSGDAGLVSHTNLFRIGRLYGKMKHNSFTLPLYVKSFGSIHMKCSSLTAAAWPKCVGTTVWLDAKDSSTLIGRLFEDVDQTTASHPRSNTQDPEGDDPYYPKQAGKKEPKVPRLYASKDCISQLRYPIPKKCVFVVGFKPKSWLEHSWQMREAYFIRPDDHSTIEMREKCAALYQAMKDRDVVGVVCFTKTDQSEPRLAALLPLFTEEAQAPLGFSMLELPFADDIRHPEVKSDALGYSVECAQDGIRIAEDVVRKHPVPPEYYPGVALNPHIQAHFSLLSNLVLDEETMEQEHHLVTDEVDCNASLLLALNEFKEHHLLH